MTDPKAKVRIVGQNELGAAFKGALGDADKFTRKLGGMFKTTLALAGFAATAEGVRRLAGTVFATSKEIDQLIVSSRNLGEVREKLGALSDSVTDDDLRNAAELARTVNDLTAGFRSVKIEAAAATSSVLDFFGLGSSDTALDKRLDRLQRKLEAFRGTAAEGEIRAEINSLEKQLGRTSSGPARRRFAGQGTPQEARDRIQERDRLANPAKFAEAARKAALEADLMQRQAAQIQTDALRAFRPLEGGGTEFDRMLEINQALAEGSIEALETLSAEAERQAEVFGAATSTMTVFAEEAGRNIQGALSDFLFDPFAEGLDGMLKGFVDVLRRMVAEAAAAQILKGLGGLFAPTSFLGSFFGGFRAAGGPVEGGRAYMVGEQGPELLIPRGDGTILPNSALRGGAAWNVTVAPVYNIDARGNSDLERKLPAILAMHARQTVEMARKALNDDVSRGAFGRA